MFGSLEETEIIMLPKIREPDASETGEEFRDMITMTQKGKLKNEKTVRPKANESRPGSAFSFLKGFT